MKILTKIADAFSAIVAELLEYKIFLYALILLTLLINGEVVRVLHLRVGDAIAYVVSLMGFSLSFYCLGYMSNDSRED